jgi:enoyl-[acyl-carrier-protein] reductase (NADH)
MERNTKISFGVLAGAYALTVAIFSVRLAKVEKLLAVVDTTQDKLLSHMDAKFQQEVDDIFEDIKDNYDE